MSKDVAVNVETGGGRWLGFRLRVFRILATVAGWLTGLRVLEVVPE